MSKINQNKIISIFFGIISITLVLLSFQKAGNETIIDNSKENDEIVDLQLVDKEESLNNEDNYPKEVILENINNVFSEKEFSSEVNYLNYDLILGSKKINGLFEKGDSLYDSLLRMKKKDLIDFEEKNFSGLGSYIYSINGISENKKEGEYWIYYVNGQQANVGVSNYLLKEKDEIRWQLENNTY